MEHFGILFNKPYLLASGKHKDEWMDSVYYSDPKFVAAVRQLQKKENTPLYKHVWAIDKRLRDMEESGKIIPVTCPHCHSRPVDYFALVRHGKRDKVDGKWICCEECGPAYADKLREETSGTLIMLEASFSVLYREKGGFKNPKAVINLLLKLYGLSEKIKAFTKEARRAEPYDKAEQKKIVACSLYSLLGLEEIYQEKVAAKQAPTLKEVPSVSVRSNKILNTSIQGTLFPNPAH